MSHRVHKITSGLRGASDEKGSKKESQKDLQQQAISEAVKSIIPTIKPGETAWFTKSAKYEVTIKTTSPARANTGEYIPGEHKKAVLRFDVPFVTSDPEINEGLKKHVKYRILFWTAEDQIEKEQVAEADKVREAVKTLKNIKPEVREMLAGELKDLDVAEFPVEALKE